MYKSKLRLLGVSALVGAGLMAAGPAEAYNVRLGNVDIQVDSSLSLGASWKVDDSFSGFYALANGGNPDLRPVVEFFTFGGALGQGANAAEAAVAANKGTATSVDASCGAYASLCLNVGSSEAGALNGAYTGGVAKVLNDPNLNTKENRLAAEAAIAALPASNFAVAGPINYDASVNGDDGRLNFESGDMISQTTKFVTEVEARMGNLRGFMRINGFYDSALDDDDNFLRSKGGILDEGRDDAVANIQILDAFVDYDTNIGDVPVLVRVGNQVINWGESTFFTGGNSVFNAIDVPAIRRPGAEIKDALLPVEAAYVSASLTDALSIEAYIGGHEPFKLDVGGTHFANSDILVNGTGLGGNNGIGYVGGGFKSGSNKLNLDTAGVALVAGGYGLQGGTKAIQDAIAATADHAVTLNSRDKTHPQHYDNGSPVGEIETFRSKWEDTNQIDHLGDINVSEDAMGIAARYYAENLNSTEFGFYYQKYTSRIPYVGYRAQTPSVGIGTVSNNTSATTAALAGRSACDRNYFGNAAAGPQAAAFSMARAGEINIGNDASDDIKDTHHNWAALKAAGQAVHASWGAKTVSFSYHTTAAATISAYLQTASGGGKTQAEADQVAPYMARVAASIDATSFASATGAALYGAVTDASHIAATNLNASKLGFDLPAQTVIGGLLKAAIAAENVADIATYTAMLNTADETTEDKPWTSADLTHSTMPASSWFTLMGVGDVTGDTYTDLMDANCLIGIANGSADGATDVNWWGDYTLNGAMHGGISYDSDLFIYYPEDIEAYGVSFNTTAFGWGIQGEVTLRPDFPLLVDTRCHFIASVSAQCAFPLSGDAGVGVYAPLVTHGEICDTGPVGNSDHFSHVELDTYNWDIGTTATFTRSNPVVAALGADLGVLLTEFGGVSVPDIDQTYAKQMEDGELTGKDQVKRLQGICTAGSDLPLGSLLDFDAVAVNSCRPTENSYGGLILASLQYNNVFGTPWGLTPTLIMREGLHGYSPGPAVGFRKDVGSTSLSLSGSYQGYLTVSLSYTDYTGPTKYSKTVDQDQASFSVSYAF